MIRNSISIDKRIVELAIYNPTVNSIMYYDDISNEEKLVQMVLHLAKNNDLLSDKLVDIHQNGIPSVIIKSNSGMVLTK